MQGSDTALFAACKEGHEEVAKALLAGGADVNAKNTDGATALFVACKGGHIEVAQVLLATGADINAPDTVGVAWTGWRAVHGWGCMLVIVGLDETAAAAAQFTPLKLLDS
ncbi:Ankyrin repeat domain-containing protein 29 [Tetrabaena socialis]|uniref:Ankyrin repeat domain-containing protein 29 n=1 Tax=Tetrabaena socialis TaxID=47790 RepID=A0A2J8A849_9CHLO|nr:Ankyrin repeat domain-containing protein 29 [Tetrabaena socialis]|eukprot:PNH08670.1 Ankyrin repeat domain-containing protein 29 [Tetrabaena socialis]